MFYCIISQGILRYEIDVNNAIASGELSEKRFGALVQRAMTYDVERGILLAQIPHITYHHSKWFKKWEKRLWRKINKRLKTVSDDF